MKLGVRNKKVEKFYRLYIPIDDSTDINLHRDLSLKFLNLIHRLGYKLKILLVIDNNGSSIYFSMPEPKILKTVYRNISNDNLKEEYIEFNNETYFFSSYQTKKKFFLGQENSKVDFFEYILSYKSRLEHSKIMVLIELIPAILSLKIPYDGNAFKFNIKIFYIDEYDKNFNYLISNFWSNQKSSLNFKKKKSNFLNFKNYGMIIDEIAILFIPFPGKILEMSGISTRFVNQFKKDIELTSVKIGKGILSGRDHYLKIYDNNGQGTFILGETGSGKSSLMLSIILNIINENKPVILIDPTGDTAKDFIKRLDRNFLKRVIYINPVETPVSMNILNVPDGKNRGLAVSRIAEDTIQVLKNVTEAETGIQGGLVGSKIEEIIRNSISGLVNIKGSTLLDISYIITKPSVRKHLKNISKDYEFREFLDDLDNFSNDEVSSTRRTISFLKTNQVLRTMICNKYPRFNVSDAIDKNMIIVVDGERGKVGERVSTFILSSFISMLWISIQERYKKESIFLFCDEFQDYINSSFEDMLILGRKEKLNLFMATTHLSTIPENVRESIMANAKNFILFHLSPSDARDFSEKFSIEKHELMNLVPGIAFFKNAFISEICKIDSNIPKEKGNESLIIEKSKSYVSYDNTISPVLDIFEESISLFLDLILLDNLHMSKNINNVISLRSKFPDDLKNIYNDDFAFIREIVEKLSLEKIIKFKGEEILINDLWNMVSGNEKDIRIIKKLLGLKTIVRIKSLKPLILICVPYSIDSFNPLNKSYFTVGIECEADISINEENRENCDHCFMMDDFLNFEPNDNLINLIMGLCISSTDDDILITTSHRIAEALRKFDKSLDMKYDSDLEKIIKVKLVENNYAEDGERIIIDGNRVRTLEIKLKNAREKFKPIKTDVNLKVK